MFPTRWRRERWKRNPFVRKRKLRPYEAECLLLTFWLCTTISKVHVSPHPAHIFICHSLNTRKESLDLEHHPRPFLVTLFSVSKAFRISRLTKRNVFFLLSVLRFSPQFSFNSYNKLQCLTLWWSFLSYLLLLKTNNQFLWQTSSGLVRQAVYVEGVL